MMEQYDNEVRCLQNHALNVRERKSKSPVSKLLLLRRYRSMSHPLVSVGHVLVYFSMYS